MPNNLNDLLDRIRAESVQQDQSISGIIERIDSKVFLDDTNQLLENLLNSTSESLAQLKTVLDSIAKSQASIVKGVNREAPSQDKQFSKLSELLLAIDQSVKNIKTYQPEKPPTQWVFHMERNEKGLIQSITAKGKR